MDTLILTGPTPVAHHVGNAFIPVIYHPGQGPERFPRKARATLAEAIEYARRVIHYRHIRVAEKRRKLEALSHPRFATWAEYQTATPAQQRASWRAILTDWQANAERELDADVRFDHSVERRAMWGACE
jgi:hypothetical protein